MLLSTDTDTNKPLDLPVIWRLAKVASCLDTAFNLAGRNMLPIWGSVQVSEQTAGRGQIRRHWHSPPGNLYAAVRLPVVYPFDGSEAAPFTGTLLAEALNAEGWPVLLKWPNDLVLRHEKTGKPLKVSGTLLEKRGDILLAGIGVNMVWAPTREQLRDDASLEATCLARYPRSNKKTLPTAEALWPRLVSQLFSAYTQSFSSIKDWKKHAESLLLWRGMLVQLRDGDHSICGRVAGLGPSGGIMLEHFGIQEEFCSGSLHLITNESANGKFNGNAVISQHA